MSITWNIPKDALEGACNILSNVPPRNGIKASEYIKIRAAGKDGADFMLSSDLMARALIRTGERFPFKRELFIDRRLFLPFVFGGKESKTTTYTITKRKDKLIVKHGNRRAVYDTLKPVSGYEDLPEMKAARVVALDKRWIALVDAARDCATDDPITPNLNCVYIHPTKKALEVFSSNGRVIFQGKTAREKTIHKSIAFPLLLIDSLRLENATKLHWTNRIALIEFKKGKIWQSVKVAARKSFPVDDIRKMMSIASADNAVLSINSTTLASTAKRIADYVAALSRDSLVLSLRMSKGSRKVVIESGAEASKFQESLSMLEPSKQDVHIQWPLEEVMPVLLYIKDDGIAKIRMNQNGRTCLSTKSVTLIVAAPTKAEEPKKAEKK